MSLTNLVRPPCPHCDGKGGFMDGYYEPEFSGCPCCNPDEENEDVPTRVWRFNWWVFRFRFWLENYRIDRWIDREVAKMERPQGERSET